MPRQALNFNCIIGNFFLRFSILFFFNFSSSHIVFLLYHFSPFILFSHLRFPCFHSVPPFLLPFPSVFPSFSLVYLFSVLFPPLYLLFPFLFLLSLSFPSFLFFFFFPFLFLLSLSFPLFPRLSL